jgi:hypothetical protein
LKTPASEVLPIVKYLGERGKIHQVHIRNIRGSLYNFAEVYPDEGEIDFLKVMRILRDVQFAGSICPDHMPTHPDDPAKLQAYAFSYGYIKALIHAVNSEVWFSGHSARSRTECAGFVVANQRWNVLLFKKREGCWPVTAPFALLRLHRVTLLALSACAIHLFICRCAHPINAGKPFLSAALGWN